MVIAVDVSRETWVWIAWASGEALLQSVRMAATVFNQWAECERARDVLYRKSVGASLPQNVTHRTDGAVRERSFTAHPAGAQPVMEDG